MSATVASCGDEPAIGIGTPCSSSRQCSGAGLVCDADRGECVECAADIDCTGPEQICRRNVCETVIPCTTSRMCPGLVCSPTRGICVECVIDVDCAEGERCAAEVCESAPTSCASDRECSALGLVCDLDRSECVECVLDTDCFGGALCRVDRTCGDSLDGGVPPADAAPDGAGPIDAPVDVRGVTDAGDRDAPPSCISGPLGGIGIPAGTVASASTVWKTYVPSRAFDGDRATEWLASAPDGWIRLDFPSPVTINGIRFAAAADPPSSERYFITETGASAAIGDATLSLVGIPTPTSPRPALPPIPLISGTYSGLLISIESSGSWVEIAEVSLLTAACP